MDRARGPVLDHLRDLAGWARILDDAVPVAGAFAVEALHEAGIGMDAECGRCTNTAFGLFDLCCVSRSSIPCCAK